MKPRMIALICVSAMSLSACAGTIGPEEMPPSLLEVDAQIAASVEKAANANAAIAEVEVATAEPVRPGPTRPLPDTVVLPPEAVQPISVDWNGPVEGFLRDVSERAGYRFNITGRAPTNQVMVSISANQEPLFGVVRRAAAMIHGVGDVALNPTEKTITLRYGG